MPLLNTSETGFGSISSFSCGLVAMFLSVVFSTSAAETAKLDWLCKVVVLVFMASEEVITTGDSGLIRADGKEMATFGPSITGVEGVVGSTRGTVIGKGVAVVLSLSSGVRRELVASVSGLVPAFKGL